MALAQVTLDDKYTAQSGRVFLVGIQALVRLPMMQRQRDLAAGRHTAGYISGYRGSPLGGLDQQLERAQALLEAHHVRFRAGVNEDLAATAVWGTQQAELNGEGSYDGVFAMWYAKGPGVDRSGDALRHGNLAGTSPHGGVLALLGDDHLCESSTTAHQSEFAMVDAMIPVLNPAGVQEILDYGLYGWALSRYSGCWVGLKCVHDTVEASATVAVDAERVRIVQPDDFQMPAGGLNIRWPDSPQEQEARLHGHKLEAARAFCRANRLDRTVADSPRARLGVVTTGKSYLDVRQALDELGVDEDGARRLGLRVYKVAMSWPLEPSGVERFCAGLDRVVVVEEKRALIETQLKELMYGRPGAPRVIGKRDEEGGALFPSAGRLDASHIAAVIGRRLLAGREDRALAARLERIEALLDRPAGAFPAMLRLPYFCPGCPHNTSTRVPQGSKALAGIGCHFMAVWMDRGTERFTQMGAEGASWIGEAPFSKRPHMFQNIGDGTYFHSGLLAVRAAVAAGTSITFKVLYNDAVAMTGGQSVDGPLTVPQITRQVAAEGVERVVVVTDEPHKYTPDDPFARGVRVHHRDRLDAVQRQLREVEGVTVLVYDQTCAAEKRRRRKRGLYPDPPRRVFINEAVCEGCGDCGVQSNCVAVVPLETELGRKRAINQSACNKDFSCLNGFCPSFVTVHGGRLRRRAAASAPATDGPALPEPTPAALDAPFAIVITGVGGTGVITIGALLGMAAHLEGKGCSILDMTGLAQKGGAVVSHLRITTRPDDVQTSRIGIAGAHLLLGCDLVVAAAPDTLKTLREGVTQAVVNTEEVMTGDFTRNADMPFPAEALERAVQAAAGPGHTHFVAATRLAGALLGDAIASNLLMVGYAYQKGLLPLSGAAIERAIELNGVAVEMNKRAFLCGRRAAASPEAVERALAPARQGPSPSDLNGLIRHRAAYLARYQDGAYAQRYERLARRVRRVEAERAKGMSGLAEAVARYYFKLLAYKDEYEVARLYTEGDFLDRVREQLEGEIRIEVNLAPPLLARRDPDSGEQRTRAYGPWMLSLMRLLARFRFLRGSVLDPFGRTRERRRERELIRAYERVVAELLDNLDPENHELAVEIACIPEQIRGFGHVKTRHLQAAKQRERELLAAFHRREETATAA